MCKKVKNNKVDPWSEAVFHVSVLAFISAGCLFNYSRIVRLIISQIFSLPQARRIEHIIPPWQQCRWLHPWRCINFCRRSSYTLNANCVFLLTRHSFLPWAWLRNFTFRQNDVAYQRSFMADTCRSFETPAYSFSDGTCPWLTGFIQSRREPLYGYNNNYIIDSHLLILIYFDCLSDRLQVMTDWNYASD